MSQENKDRADAAEARTQQTRGFMQQVRVAARRTDKTAMGLSHAPIRSLLAGLGASTGHPLVESTDHYEGTAPVPFRARPDQKVAWLILLQSHFAD